jgi:hypothetical protein
MPPAARAQKPATPETLRLRGTVGERLRVSMHLTPAAAGALTGTYHYEKDAPYVPRPLSLKGTRGADGRVTLTESDDAGKVTGRFAGTLTLAAPCRFTGTWTSGDGARRSLPFSLADAAPGGTGIKVAGQFIRESSTKKPVPYDIDLAYPRLTGGPGLDGFNRTAEAAVRAELAAFRRAVRGAQQADSGVAPPEGGAYGLDGGVTLESVTDRVVSATLAIYSYTGGAHGTGWTRALNVDRRTGTALSLRDVFAPSVDPLALLSKLCKPALQADLGADLTFPEGITSKAENFRSWTIGPAGLTVTFDVYQVAAYAVGPREVVLPWPALKPYLRPDGPAAAFL